MKLFEDMVIRVRMVRAGSLKSLACWYRGRHMCGEWLGQTVCRCETCGKMYQPPKFVMVRVERVSKDRWRREAA